MGAEMNTLLETGAAVVVISNTGAVGSGASGCGPGSIAHNDIDGLQDSPLAGAGG